MSGFVGRQIAAVRSGGLVVLWRKATHHAPRLVLTLIFFTPALLCALLMRLLSPFVLVRTGRLVAFRIGHYVGNSELYLSRRDEMEGRRPIDLFSHWGTVCNIQVKRMLDRVLPTSWFYGVLHAANRILPGFERHFVDTERGETERDWTGVTMRTSPHLFLTPLECARGERELREILGVGGPIEWVCLHQRDSAFLRDDSPMSDYSYHDFRDSDVETFREAATLLNGRGMYVMRMGAVVERPLEQTGPMLADYATTARTDFMDVYLEANCRFHLGDSSGLNEIPRAFRRPVVTTNWIPVLRPCMHTIAPNGLFIPKKLWSEELGRFWTFREFFEAPISEDDWYISSTYSRLGLRVVDNTAEEIREIACEMDDRISGTWVETEEDRLLQQRFWELFGDDSHELLGARIGAHFLRSSRSLLD